MEAVESGPVRQCPPGLIYLETVLPRSLDPKPSCHNTDGPPRAGLDFVISTGLEHADSFPGAVRQRTRESPTVTTRTGAWIKLKLHLEQEFVIGGYTDPEGGRKYLGSLLVGFYQDKNLKFAGRVGTGFSAGIG